MNVEQLVNAGNQLREENQPLQALAHYAQAFILDPDNFSAWNNYGNVLRECGRPDRAVAFLQNALAISPDQPTANFNLAVAYLLMGDYTQGWPQYESRWRYEHLNGLLPNLQQPRWTGQDLKDKTLLIFSEQGHGDNIQFVRFITNLLDMGAKIKLQINSNLIPLFSGSDITIYAPEQDCGEFDYWTPIMSIPGTLGITLDKLSQELQYITPDQTLVKVWRDRLGLKNRLRVGFCWSGRRDTWINRHKGMPFDEILSLIKKNPDYEWVNLQIECTPEEQQLLTAAGVKLYSGCINNFSDTAALVHHLDVVLSVDTAIAHLAGAMGRPTWIMLNAYGLDWRWLLNREDSPWYPSARLFRQPTMGDWRTVTDKIHQYLSWFKI